MGPGRLGLVLTAVVVLLGLAPTAAEEPRELAGNSTVNTTATDTTTTTSRTSTTSSITATTVTSTLTNTTTATTTTATITTSTSTTMTTTTSTTSRTTTTTTTTTTTSRTTTTVTTTSVELGLAYCPAPTYYLEHQSSPLARCSATTLRPSLPPELAGPTAAPTATRTATTTTAATTATGSQGFSESLLSHCCRSREQSSTNLPYTSINYLYQWPTTTTTTTPLTTLDPFYVPPTTTTTATTTTGTSSTSTTVTVTTTSTNTTSTTTTTSSTSTATPYVGPSTTATSTSSFTMTRTATTFTSTDSSTSTTSSTTTLTTTTTSITTITATTVTATTTTTTTATSTSSKTTTSTTRTSTTTTTSPRLFPCRTRCPRLPVTGCEAALSPGGRCLAPKIDTHCVSQQSLLFLCPIWNVDPLRAPDILGEYRLYCQVCGLAAWPLVDLDMRLGWLQLDIQFGPNAYQGQVLEDGVSGYAIFMTDPDGHRLSDEPVTSVDKKQGPHESGYCCMDTAYTARVATAFPENVSRVLFEIVPITRAGPLPSGRLTAPVYDRGNPAALASARRSAAWPPLAVGSLLALAAAVAAGTRDPG